ncbi:hypothetical protein DFH29DRAFT_881625 [Suillus ampliporus]|nr:hypothetical protein DFH29DRAFT_881625 [Suillus ampliporus]
MELDGSPPCDENVGANEPGGANIKSVIDTAQLDSTNAPDSVEQEDSQSDSPPMGAAERRKKLWEWFRNNSKGKTTPSGSSAGRALSVLLGQRMRGTRDLKEIEVYSKLHYESKVKLLVSDTLKNNVVQPTQRLSTVRQHTAECFVDESEEVKKEIREETVHLNASRRLGDVAGQHLRTKEEVYQTIQELPLILVTTTGKTADGLSFKASTPNFHEQYLLPFERHLGHIHDVSSKCISAPSSTPTSSCLTPINLIQLDGFPNESSLGGNMMSGPVVDPSLFDQNLIPSPCNMADMPITTWRKSMVLNEDLLTSPTFNRIQQRGSSTPSLLFPAREEVNTLSTPVEHRSSPGFSPAVASRQTQFGGRTLHPSMRADGANKIGDYNPQHETKLTPKRKQTKVQHGAGGSKKKSWNCLHSTEGIKLWEEGIYDTSLWVLPPHLKMHDISCSEALSCATRNWYILNQDITHPF